MTTELPSQTDRRQDVIDAAARVFAARGYHGAGMREIADQLGMKAGSLYFHLESKDAALEAVCVTGLNSALRAAEHALAAGPDLATRISALIAAEARELVRHADYMSVHLHERRHLSEAGKARLADVTRAYRALLDRMFAEAMARGELAQGIDVRAASLFMVGVLRNQTQLYVDGPIRDFDAFCDDATHMLLRGICRSADG